ncbi:cutinase family protein [uncultured Friedmanniella sp.]|uniref:cutinase family protein n=1 Tax=uncultured Friedmanniella sp. TaxID=335381 RepID=UPI0035C995BE
MPLPALSRPALSRPARLAAGLVLIASSALVGLAVTSTSASAATCSDVDISFARGTGESAGLGTVGRPFVTSLTSDLSGRTVSSYAVDYAANSSQSSAGPGATDLTNHVTSLAASCPNTQFVLGGYSQGATVVDIALGIRTGTSTGTAIPTSLAPRVKAVVVFGNPLGLQRQTIATASTLYGPKSRDYCNTGDPVCGNGSNVAAHLQYASNGSTTAGAQFAAGLITAGPTTPPTTTPPTTTPPTPTPTPSATCVRASNADHVAAGRATDLFNRAYATGSRDYLGLDSRYVTTSLTSTGNGSWSRVSSC